MKQINEYLNESLLGGFYIMWFGCMGLLLCMGADAVEEYSEGGKSWKEFVKSDGIIKGTVLWICTKFENIKDKIMKSKIADQVQKVADSKEMKEYMELPKDKQTRKGLESVVTSVLGTKPEKDAVMELWNDIKSEAKLPKEAETELQQA